MIIARGSLVRSSSLADLARLAVRSVRVTAPDAAGLDRLVAERWPTAVERPPAGSPGWPPGTVVLRDVDAPSVGAAAFAAGLELHELASRDVGLEDLFLQLTADPGAPTGRPTAGSVRGAA